MIMTMLFLVCSVGVRFSLFLYPQDVSLEKWEMGSQVPVPKLPCYLELPAAVYQVSSMLGDCFHVCVHTVTTVLSLQLHHIPEGKTSALPTTHYSRAPHHLWRAKNYGGIHETQPIMSNVIHVPKDENELTIINTYRNMHEHNTPCREKI